jgi:hypothetical protein
MAFNDRQNLNRRYMIMMVHLFRSEKLVKVCDFALTLWSWLTSKLAVEKETALSSVSSTAQLCSLLSCGDKGLTLS